MVECYADVDPLIYADWIEDQGIPTADLREWAEAGFVLLHNYGNGDGDGDGNGYGNGYGYGYGNSNSYGYGNGYGYGNDDGN